VAEYVRFYLVLRDCIFVITRLTVTFHITDYSDSLYFVSRLLFHSYGNQILNDKYKEH